MFFTER